MAMIGKAIIIIIIIGATMAKKSDVRGCSAVGSRNDGPRSVEELAGRMDGQDTNHNMKPEDDDDDEADEAVQDEINRVMNSNIEASTRYGYQLTQRKMILHFYKKTKKLRTHLLHVDTEAALDLVAIGKGVESRLLEAAMEEAKRASSDFAPIILENLEPKHFIGYLLSLSDTGSSHYRRNYGDCRSGMTNLFTTCGVVPSVQSSEL
jgi:hypothetical protein